MKRGCRIVALVVAIALGLPPVEATARKPGSHAARGRAGAGTPTTSTVDTCSPSIATMKAAAAKIEARNPTPDDFAIAFDQALGIDSSRAAESSYRVEFSNDLAIFVIFPYQNYRLTAKDAIRKGEPTSSVLPLPLVAVSVSPRTLESADITKIIVERDGRVVPPSVNALLPKVLATRLGAKTILHAGSVLYPTSAFAPGATVKVTAIPEFGDNMDYTFDEDDLLMFSNRRSELLTSLLGHDPAFVENAIGKPTKADPRIWSYEVGSGVIHVYWNEGATAVIRVDAAAMKLSEIKPR